MADSIENVVSDSNQARDSRCGTWLAIALLFLSVVLTVAGLAYVFARPQDAVLWFKNLGQYDKDLFEKVASFATLANAAISALALLAVVLTLFLQSRELSHQVAELRAQQKELAEQKKALQQQDKRLREANYLQVFQAMFREYRSAEMLLAVKALWDLRRSHKNDEDMVKEYLATMRTDLERIKKTDSTDQSRLVEATLHHRRRIVENFYYLLAGVRQCDAMDPKTLFSYWSLSDLEIIPRILAPIAQGLSTELNTPQDKKGADYQLMAFYNGARLRLRYPPSTAG